ncbi:hypothetical protein [Streptosporangium canum]|nr:hypothetical protein [Streptosporangium canum]
MYDVNVANQIAEDQIDDLSDPEFEVLKEIHEALRPAPADN